MRSDLPSLTQLQIQQIMTQAVNTVVEVLINHRLTVESVFDPGRNLFTELSRREALPAVHEWLRQVCLTAASAVTQANSRQANKKVTRISEYIEQHLTEDLSLNDVAEWIDLSPAYVSRIFKEGTGENFVEYLSERRVEQAELLLKNTHLSIKEVGFKCGFNNMQTFIRTFKKISGCTPSQYRGG